MGIRTFALQGAEMDYIHSWAPVTELEMSSGKAGAWEETLAFWGQVFSCLSITNFFGNVAVVILFFIADHNSLLTIHSCPLQKCYCLSSAFGKEEKDMLVQLGLEF